MAFFQDFTSSIRQKWLDYVNANRAWLDLQMRETSVRTPDGGRRPSSFLVLGVVNAIEPKLSNLMVPFYQLNADEDALVEVLGLNFDPEMVLDGAAPEGRTVGQTPLGQTLEAQSEGETPLLPNGQDILQ